MFGSGDARLVARRDRARSRASGRAMPARFPWPLGRLMALGLVAVLSPFVAAQAVAQQQELTVEVQEIQDLKAVFATVESVDETLARSRIGGTLRDLAVDEGSQVRSGEVIAWVEDEKLPLELAALDSRIRAAQSELQRAAIELERMQTLRERGTVSQAALDDAQTGLDVANGALAALKAERAVVVQRQAEGAVEAPADGRVLQVRVTNGQVVLPGDVVAEIATETYILRLHLPERHARFLQVGDPVLVGARGLAADGDGLREGEVVQVYPELDRGRVVADARVSGLGDYFVGERTRVFVSAGTRETIVVPENYLYRRHGVTYVRHREAGEVVVQPGRPVAGGLEILSGLVPGDVLLPRTGPADDSGGAGQ